MWRIFGKIWYVDNEDALTELKQLNEVCDEILKELEARKRRDIEFAAQIETFLKDHAGFTDQDFERIRIKSQLKNNL